MFAASCSTLFICFALPWHGTTQSINNDNVHCGFSYAMREKLLRCELHELGEYEECVIIEFINQVDVPRYFFSRWTLENARRD